MCSQAVGGVARLPLGEAVVGILLYGVLLVIMLFNLNRRLSKEECVFQVTGTIAIAYLSYFVSEVLLHCSGILVLAVVQCGLTTKASERVKSMIYGHRDIAWTNDAQYILFFSSSSMTQSSDSWFHPDLRMPVEFNFVHSGRCCLGFYNTGLLWIRLDIPVDIVRRSNCHTLGTCS